MVILLAEEPDLVVAATAGEIASDFRGTRLPAADAAAVRGALEERGLPAHALVPLQFRGRSLGMLAAVGGDPSAEDEQLLLAFAASAATAVATARSVEEQRLRESVAGAEAERGRWARELHDETLQGLGGLRMLVSAARRREDADSMRAALEEVLRTIDGEIESLRTLIRELRPAALDELGPAPAVEELAARTAARHGLEITTDLAFEGRRSPEVETTLYRIIQEGLTNAVKHAGASRVAVEASEAAGALRLSVTDDGHGFDPSAPGAGFGLAGMRERVLLLGGTLDVQSGPGGTRIEATLPAG
jgi:signal transduction histidine kinase